MTVTEINYGVNQRVRTAKGSRIAHANHKATIDGSYSKDRDAFYGKVKTLVAERHPGWHLTGFAVVSEK